MKFQFGLIALLLGSLTSHVASAMEFQRHTQTLIMSGPVVAGDLAKLKDFLQEKPPIEHVVLRNSWGGDAWTGYRVGEIFREKRIETSVSGHCVSSCSRMFLGGIKRHFSNDYPPERTFVGFHGHYNSQGQLNTKSVQELGLYRWIIKHLDGKADEDLVKRWVNIPLANGMVAFLPQRTEGLPSTYFCHGTESKRPLGCEALPTDALTRGVVTASAYKPSPDQSELREKIHPQLIASGYASAEEINKVPLDPPAGIANYQKFLLASEPKAFAISLDRQFWAWNSGSDDVIKLALQRCAERAKQTCTLYATDEQVVFVAQPLQKSTQ